MKRMKKRPWQVLLTLLFIITAVIEFMSIHNLYAKGVMIIATAIVLFAYYVSLKVVSCLESMKHDEKWIMRNWLIPIFFHAIAIVAFVSLVAWGTSAIPNTSIHWPGIILTDIVVFIAIMFGGVIGIHRGVQEEP